MLVWGMVLGGYPRSRTARYALRDYERGRISLSEYHSRMLLVHAEVIGAQKAAGLPVVVDGMIDWHDMFRPFVESWRNTAVDGLLRFFDNNFFYRIPVFTGEPDIVSPVLSKRVREFAGLADPAGLKVVVPGPVTLASMSRNETGLDKAELAEKIAVVVRREVELALESGASMVQIDEPFLADVDAARDDAILAKDLVNEIVKGFEDKSILAIYFNMPSSDVFEEVLDVKAKYVMVDVADAWNRAVERLNEKGIGGHTPVLGVVDARRIHDDDFNKIKSHLDRIEPLRNVEELVLTTTAWLDLIPYRYSLRKTSLLGRLVEYYADKVGAQARSLWG